MNLQKQQKKEKLEFSPSCQQEFAKQEQPESNLCPTKISQGLNGQNTQHCTNTIKYVLCAKIQNKEFSKDNSSIVRKTSFIITNCHFREIQTKHSNILKFPSTKRLTWNPPATVKKEHEVPTPVRQSLELKIPKIQKIASQVS